MTDDDDDNKDNNNNNRFLLRRYGYVKVHLHSFLTSALDGVNSQFDAPTALPLAKELSVTSIQ